MTCSRCKDRYHNARTCPAEAPEPRPSLSESIPSRLMRFLQQNPGEELTIEDVAAKFDCSYSQAHGAVRHLRSRKRLETMFVVRLARK